MMMAMNMNHSSVVDSTTTTTPSSTRHGHTRRRRQPQQQRFIRLPSIVMTIRRLILLLLVMMMIPQRSNAQSTGTFPSFVCSSLSLRSLPPLNASVVSLTKDFFIFPHSIFSFSLLWFLFYYAMKITNKIKYQWK